MPKKTVKTTKKVVKKPKEEAVLGAEKLGKVGVTKVIHDNGMRKDNPSGIEPDLYCDCCGAALKIINYHNFAINDDCNEYPNYSNVK